METHCPSHLDARRRLAGALLALLLASLTPGAARAITSYEYVGNPYNLIGELPGGPPGTYTTDMFVAGSFEVAMPLPPGLPFQDVSGQVVSLRFFDGRNTIEAADADVSFSVGVQTDADGDILTWEIDLQATATPAFPDDYAQIFTRYRGNTISISDSGLVGPQFPEITNPRDAGLYTLDELGSWTTLVPEPAGLVALVVLASFVAGPPSAAARRRGRSSSAAGSKQGWSPLPVTRRSSRRCGKWSRAA